MTPKRLIVWSGTLVAALGAATPAAAQPAWCDQPGADRLTSYNVKYAIDNTGTDGLVDLVGVLCDPREQEGRGAEVEVARKRWAKELYLTDADWAEVRIWAALGGSDRNVVSMLLDPRGTSRGFSRAKLAWSDLTPMDHFAVMQNGYPADSDTESHDPSYVADALGTKLTEVGRLGYILTICRKGELRPIDLARCIGDIAVLDRKKLLQELRADRDNRYSVAERMWIRLGVRWLDQNRAVLEEQVKKWKAKDPAYAKMFEIAAEQRKLWSEHQKTHAALLDLTLAMEDARATGSRKRYEGCDARTWDAWKTAIGAMPQSAFSDVVIEGEWDTYTDAAAGAILRDPAGYLASVALILCHEHDENRDGLVEKLATHYKLWPGARGPRTSIQAAILQAGLELDDRTERIELPKIERVYRTKNYGTGARLATFASAKRAGKGSDNVVLTWAAKAVKHSQCVDMRTSRRISRIDANGNVQYERTCMKYKNVVSRTTIDPMTVNGRYAAGLKKGMLVAMIGNDVPFIAWPKGGKTPTIIAGVPLAK